jgi:hypothetical protein
MMHRLILILAICATPTLAQDRKKAAPADLEPKWTIVCGTFSGPDHAAQARAMKDYVVKLSGMKGFYLIQAADRTEINFGQYHDLTEQAQADRKAIAALVNPANGDKLFRAALLQPIDGDDPVAPKEWDLRNARGYWSLEVASYRNDSKRKQAAVELVKQYRKDGYDAYFYHGQQISSVCIGAFPYEAVSAVDYEVREDPITKKQLVKRVDPDEVRSADPNEAVMVIPPHLPIPETPQYTPEGRPVRIVQHKRDIVDPRLLELKRVFPHHADNDQVGQRVVVKGQVKEQFSPSFLVEVPGQKELRRAQLAGGRNVNPDQPQQGGTAVVGPNLVRVPGADNGREALPADPRNVGATANALPPEGPANPQPANAAPPKIKPPVKKPQGGKLKSIDD